MNSHLPDLRVHSQGLNHLGFLEESQNIELLPLQRINGLIATLFQLHSKNTHVTVPNGRKAIKILLLALWILKLLILQCLCSIRYWYSNEVNSEQRNSWYLMIGILTDCRGCIKTVIPNSWFFCLESVAWIYFCLLFWSSSSGTCASSWRSSNLFTLACLGMIIFISTFPQTLMSISTSTSCHSGNTFLCKETIQCRSTTSWWILTLTIMQQPSPWDTLSEKRLTTQYSRRNRFNQTTWQNQAQYSFKILMTNCGIGVQLNSQEMVPSANASY